MRNFLNKNKKEFIIIKIRAEEMLGEELNQKVINIIQDKLGDIAI